jgi:hypothetical protein
MADVHANRLGRPNNQRQGAAVVVVLEPLSVIFTLNT